MAKQDERQKDVSRAEFDRLKKQVEALIYTHELAHPVISCLREKPRAKLKARK